MATCESREGSWEAGEHGAEPGIIMPTDPQPSTATCMEHAKGVAEDQAWVVQHLGQVRTRGWPVHRHRAHPRVEPARAERVISQKFYAAGLGIIEERDLAGGDEHFWVVSVSRRR